MSERVIEIRPLLLCSACATARGLGLDPRWRRCALDVEVEGACEDCAPPGLHGRADPSTWRPLEVWAPS